MSAEPAYEAEHVQEYVPTPPAGWQKISKKVEAGAAINELIPTVRDRWLQLSITRYPLWKFTAHFESAPQPVIVNSKCPIIVTIQKDESLVFVENEGLGIYAAGDTEQEALTDFNIQVVWQFKHYQDTDKSQLVGDAIRVKKSFLEVFTAE